MRPIALFALTLTVFAAAITTLDATEILPSHPMMLAIIRWAAIISLGLLTYKKKALTGWILFSIIAGAEIGYDFPVIAVELKFLSKIFINLIKTVVAPLLFATLVVGIAGHADLKQVGRMAWKSILYFEVVTTIALFVGLAAINISRAGVGIPQADMAGAELPAVQKQHWDEIVIHSFPENIAKSIAEGQILQIVVFSVLFGIGLAMVQEHKRKPMLDFTESLAETMFKFTNLIMYVAPIGVGAAMAYTVGKMGVGVFLNLLQLLLTLYAALFVFILCVLVPIALLLRINIRTFAKAIAEPVSIAFGTASSEAALPGAMQALEKYGVPRKIVAFVLPTGYSFNLDGSTLYLAMASVFVAQAAGIELSIGTQIGMMLTLMLTSKGIAGVARASLVILLGTVNSYGLPEWPVVIILGIDALMDMARTSVNLIGNSLAAVVVAKWEGEFDEEAANAIQESK